MPPNDVDIFGKYVNGAVWLRHGHNCFRFGVLKGCVPFCSKRHPHSQILCFGFVWLDCCSVMVEWFPLFGITIPIQSCCCSKTENNQSLIHSY